MAPMNLQLFVTTNSVYTYSSEHSNDFPRTLCYGALMSFNHVIGLFVLFVCACIVYIVNK